MKVETFDVSYDHGKLQFHEFVSIHLVDHIDTVTTHDAIWSVVYYNDNDQEQVRLAAHMTIAQQIASDYEFCNLPNERTKELWLLATWGIASADAKDIICLASDQMVHVREKAQVSQ